MQEYLYNGKWPSEIPTSSMTCTCFCGGEMFFLNRCDETLLFITKWVFATQKISSYSVLCESLGAIEGLYCIHGDGLLGLICYDDGQITQHLIKLDNNSGTGNIFLFRTITFGIGYEWIIGCDIINTGYVSLFGKTSTDSYIVRLIAGNPFEVKKYPDQNYDLATATLSQMCRSGSDNLFIYFGGLIIFNNGVGFMLARETEMGNKMIHFQLLGRVTKLCCHIQRIQFVELKGFKEAAQSFQEKLKENNDMFFSYASSNILQRSSTAWVWLLVQDISGNPRQMKAQRAAKGVCNFFNKYVGRPLNWLSRCDGGLLSSAYSKTMKAILGPTRTPQFGPPFQIWAIALDLKTLQLQPVSFGNSQPKKFRSGPSGFSFDVAANGDFFLYENSLPHKRMRCSLVTSPFRIPTLFELSYNVCIKLFPEFQLLRVSKVNGCLSFN